jgi:hypothetical protein
MNKRAFFQKKDGSRVESYIISFDRGVYPASGQEYYYIRIWYRKRGDLSTIRKGSAEPVYSDVDFDDAMKYFDTRVEGLIMQGFVMDEARSENMPKPSMKGRFIREFFGYDS